MTEYIIVTILGIILNWSMELQRAWRNTIKAKTQFHWSIFINENIVNFIVSVIAAIIIFFLPNLESLKAYTFPYITFIRMDTLFFLAGGRIGGHIIKQLMKWIESLLQKYKKFAE